MISASVKAMDVLLQEASKIPVSNGRTNFHRGKWVDPSGTGLLIYDETSVEDFLANAKAFNDRVRTEKLVPIDQRLKPGLHLGESDIIRIPTYFKAPATPKPK
jgi:hypothetical protein